MTRYELHLIASTPDDAPDATARLLGTYDTEAEAIAAGRDYLREHPEAWLQTCEPYGQGRDVEPRA